MSLATRIAEEINTVRGELLIGDNGNYAQHGLVPNDGVNEIRPQDMFEEVDVPDVLVDKKGYPVRFTDGVYDRLGEELFDIAKQIDDGNSICSQSGSVVEVKSENGGTYPRLRMEYNVPIGTTLKFSGSLRVGTSDASAIIEVYDSGWVTMASNDTNKYSSYDFTYTTTTNPLVVHYTLYDISPSIGDTVYFDNISVRELPQWQLPKAPFATGSTDELLDDKVNGLTTQQAHNKGDIVVTGNELVTNGTFDTDISGWGVSYNDVVLTYNNTDKRLVSTGTNGKIPSFYQAISVTAGATYVFVADVGVNTVTFNVSLTEKGSSIWSESVSANSSLNKEWVATTTGVLYFRGYFNSPDETLEIDNISVKLKDQSYIALEDTTAGDLLSDTSKFKPIPYVTKQVALLIEKTNTGAILNTVKPLVNMYGEESVETYEADIFGELGYSQVSDRVWTDGSSEFILVGLKGYLNGGAYHPWFNEFGTRQYWSTTVGNIAKWSLVNDELINSQYKQFVFDTVSPTVVGEVAGGNYSGNLYSNISGRPDSKFYDKTYIEGQGGLICYAIPNAKTPTYKHLEEVKRNLVDGYIENGVETWIGNIYDTAGDINISGIHSLPDLRDQWGINEYKYGYDFARSQVVKMLRLSAYPHVARAHTLTGGGITSVVGDKILIAGIKSPYLATQGSHLHTDLIGNPSNYPTSLKSVLASGKGVGFMDALLVGQDGSDYTSGTISATLSKKGVTKLDWIYSTNSVDYFIGNWKFDKNNSINSINVTDAYKVNLVNIVAQNQSAIQITAPKPIEVVDRDLIATNHHSVYAYNGLTYAGTGKVATGSSVESKSVENVALLDFDFMSSEGTVDLSIGDVVLVVDGHLGGSGYQAVKGGGLYQSLTRSGRSDLSSNEGYLYTPSWLYIGEYINTPTHNTINLDNQSIVGSKALVTQTADATQVFTQEIIDGQPDSGEFEQLTNGTLDTGEKTKVLYKASSVRI